MLELIYNDEKTNILKSDKNYKIYNKKWAEGLEEGFELQTVDRLVVPNDVTLQKLEEEFVENNEYI